MRIIERMIEIDAPTERVFDLFSDFESWPRWMRHIREVRRTGRRYTRWTADAPLGSEVEWEAEVTVFQPDRRIAWRSVRGDVETDGEVVFQETERRTTLLRIVLGYSPPGGRLGDAVARLFGTNPERQLAEDLDRFRRMAEGRDGNGRSRDRGESDYERDFAAPRRHGGRDYNERDRLGRRETFAGEHDAETDPRERGERGGDGDERAGRTLAERRFQEALREARWSQLESMRRDAEEREREERRRRRGREEARGGAGARESSARRYRADSGGSESRARPHPRASWEQNEPRGRSEEGAARQSERERRGHDERQGRPRAEREESEYHPRYALTPRERERELEQRQRQREEMDARELFRRRGVDRLLDDPPSKDWRRWE